MRQLTYDAYVVLILTNENQYLGWDIAIVRLLYVLTSIFSAAFSGILVYIVLWVVIPEE